MSEAAGAAIWELPPIDGPLLTRRRGDADLDVIEREAWNKGYADGHEAGLAAARQAQQSAQTEVDRRVQQLVQARGLVSQDPKRVAQVVKTWVGEP